jgi:hypothetical protein
MSNVQLIPSVSHKNKISHAKKKKEDEKEGIQCDF